MTMPEQSRLERAKAKQAARAKARALAKLEAQLVPGADRPVLAYRCAKSGAPFAVAFGKFRGDAQYSVIAITTETSDTDAALATSPAAKFETAAMDWNALVCPHCGASGGGVACSSCGDTVCSASKYTRADGTRHFTCQPSCKASGPIQTAETTTGHNARRLALEGPKRKALPKPAQRRLSHHKTQLPAKQ